MKQAKKIWNGVNVKIRDFLASLCFSGPSFLGMLIFFVAPFCVVIYYSFIAGALDHSFVGLKNYINVWNNGAFRIAVKTGAPVVPVAITGARALFENNGNLCHPGTVRIKVLPPIQTAGMSKAEQKQLPDAVRQTILAQL